MAFLYGRRRKRNGKDRLYVQRLSGRRKDRTGMCDPIVKEAEEAGYVSLEEKLAKGEPIRPGDKIYAAGMKKILVLFHVGTENIEKGMNILGAHIDSPRLDIKQNPLYEDTDLAYLDTHYYGGVKKYQWVALPLALHGVVAKKDGTVIQVNIGEDEKDR